jgi:hypothetical protein
LASFIVSLLPDAPPVAATAVINDAVLNSGDLPPNLRRRAREAVPLAPSELSSTTGALVSNIPVPAEATPVPKTEVRSDARRSAAEKSKTTQTPTVRSNTSLGLLY